MTRLVTLAVAAGLAGCGTNPGQVCQADTECSLCVVEEACAFCLETNECLDRDRVCPGDWAFTVDQCEGAPAESGPAQAASARSPASAPPPAPGRPEWCSTQP